jgi:hypothetical protein
VTEELRYLRPLLESRLERTEGLRVRIQRGSTIRVLKNADSVPSRLIGEWVKALVDLEEIEVRYAGQTVQRRLIHYVSDIIVAKAYGLSIATLVPFVRSGRVRT